MALSINHSGRPHAFLSPSTSHRWIYCTASPEFESHFPDSTSSYAEEGTVAHEVAELHLRRQEEEALAKAKDYEMYSHGRSYAGYIQSIIDKNQPEDHMLFVEKRVTMPPYEGLLFGTCDAILLVGQTLHIIDYKYGRGVEVLAGGNPQLLIYALLSRSTLLRDPRWQAWASDINRVTLHIYQPRIDNLSISTISIEELFEWRAKVLEPAIKAIREGNTEFEAGSHCKFCKAKAHCKAFKNQMFAPIVKQATFNPALLSDDDYREVLSKTKELKDWLSAVEEVVLQRTLAGDPVEGYKAVEGRSIRKYRDPERVIQKLKELDLYDDHLVEVVPLGITKMEKEIGKENFALLGDLVEKPEGKPTLVPESDKRQSLSVRDFDLFEELD